MSEGNATVLGQVVFMVWSRSKTGLGFKLRRLTAALLLGLVGWSNAATFTVTTTNDSGAGSFRQAIIDANATFGLDDIQFNIPGAPPYTINVGVPELPPIDLGEPVVIDATTQPGYTATNKPVIINGSGAGTNAVGLLIRAGSSSIRGLVIINFAKSGIELNGPAFSPGSNTVEACFIGTDRTGTTASPNGNGININRSTDNIIGGSLPGAGNVLSGNSGYGLRIGDTTAGARNLIVGNQIGTTAAGNVRLPNGSGGIQIDNAPSNIIGGNSAGERNIISGNGGPGIIINQGLVSPSATNNSVLGNYIGTDGSGSLVLSNGAYGVSISGSRNFIGGTNAGAGNLISGNQNSGVDMSDGASGNIVQGNLIGVSASGFAALPNGGRGVAMSSATNNLIGGTGTGARNVISGNAFDGVAIVGSNAKSNRVEGNFIGVDVTGTNRLANGFSGVWITNAPANYIGSAVQGGGNVVSGNAAQGITLFGGGATGNVIQGNLIGLDATGTRALSNGLDGVWLTNAPLNFVGKATAGGGNVISGNGMNGVLIAGVGAMSNSVVGNLIGLYAGGTAGIGNGTSANAGLWIEGASGTLVGGLVPEARNVISMNWDGIRIQGGTASNTVIQGNYIGTDVTGNQGLGNKITGIVLSGSPSGSVVGTVLGGASPGARNVISANGGDPFWRAGIDLAQYAAGTRIIGNYIGVRSDGMSPLGNLGHNIDCYVYAIGTVIGGTNAGEGNIIANAVDPQRSGVRVRVGCTGNAIVGNSIYANGKLGITFNGASPLANDDCDSDFGPNNQQNYPILSSAVSDGQVMVVTGYLNSSAGQNYRLDYYGSPTANPTGFGEGKVFLGSVPISLIGNCSNSFAVRVTAVPAGWVVTATATDQANNTSEFSSAVVVSPSPKLGISSVSAQQTTLSWWVTNSTGGTWQLLEATNLTPPVSWVGITNVPTVISNGTFFTVTLSATNNTRFYRLRLQ